MSKILITGGAGFIGSSIAKRLCKYHEIILFDNLFRNAIKDYALPENVKLVNGDVLKYETICKNLYGVDTVIHCAAIAGIDTVGKCPVDTMAVDGIGTYNVLTACKNFGIKKVLIFSTSEVFGDSSFMSAPEGGMKIGPITESRWIYATSKLFGEHLAISFNKQYGMNNIIIRPFNIYGETQVGDSALIRFTKSALKNEDLYIRNGGTQIRAWCYIDDFVNIIEKIIEAETLKSQFYNIGNNQEAITIYQLAKTVVRVLNSKSKIIFEKEKFPDVAIRIPDISLLEEFGEMEKTDLEEGIKKVANAYNSIS